MILLALLLGGAAAAYIGIKPAVLGLPFPNLGGELAIRPTFARIAGYFFGRWAGNFILGAFFGWLGLILQPPVFDRLAFSISILLAVFMFLFLITQHSPELDAARILDPTRLHLPPVLSGLLSSGTFIAPIIISVLFCFRQNSIFGAMVFFTNIFLGNAIASLPLFLNMAWVRHRFYQNLLRMIVFLCLLDVLILSTYYFLKL